MSPTTTMKRRPALTAAYHVLSTTVLMLLILPTPTEALSFVDDTGATIEFPENAKIACGAMDAVALFHFGMPASQIMYTFGERSASGSNYGGSYFDGNLVDHGLHNESVYDPTLFPADPNDAERAFLSEIKDLSPSCSASNFFCSDIDVSIMDDEGYPDLVIFGSFYGFILTDKNVQGNFTANNVPIVALTDTYGNPDVDALPRGMVEMVDRMLELAVAMGVPDAAANAKPDQEALCIASSKFKDATAVAQGKGVRVMAGYLPYAGYGPNGEVGAFLAAPERDSVLAMMEELGMPLYHTDAEATEAYEFATDFTTGSLDFEQPMSSGTLGNPVPYNIDFWLYDDRVTLDFISDSFAQKWPHVAVTEKQYAYFPAGGKVYSYRHAAEILSIVAEPLAAAERLTDPTTCTEADTDSVGHRTTGLPPGEYACLHSVTYSFCQSEATQGGTSSASSFVIPATSIGLMVFLVCFAVGL